MQPPGSRGPRGAHFWLGIPFADKVSGDKRWTLPEPHPGWEGTKTFTEDPERCIQFGLPFEEVPKKGYFGVEDCLTLDVIAPAFASDRVPTGKERLPVFVWIHGGGNVLGKPGDLTQNRLVPEEKVIIVGVRYRLGPLGMFSHAALRETGIPTANFALEDIILSLKWVQQNISAFGGDPDRVTIQGESAGAVNTYSLLLSPRASGLFHGAIMQSGLAATTPRKEAETALTDGGRPNNSADTIAKLLVQQGHANNKSDAQNMVGHSARCRAGGTAKRCGSPRPPQCLSSVTRR